MLMIEFVDEDRWVSRAVDVFATIITNSVNERGVCVIALSGSATPVPVFTELATRKLPWTKLVFIQVDERVAPAGSGERNLTAQMEALGSKGARWHSMPVDEADADGVVSAEVLNRFGTELVELCCDGRIDLVHLGIGDDGHTASLVPGDPLLLREGGVVGQSIVYNGSRRLTLTADFINMSRRIVWLAKGQAKADVLGRLISGDDTIPASLIRQDVAIVIGDAAARPAYAGTNT